MRNISEIDPNMKVASAVNHPAVDWYDVHDAPFVLYGFCEPQKKDEPFYRLPKAFAESINPMLADLASNTAGCRVRFRTDSPFVAIHAEMHVVGHMDHMPMTGMSGFDLYSRIDGADVYSGTFRPPVDMVNGYESLIGLRGEGVREATIHFPLYNCVDRLYVGVAVGSTLSAPEGYANPLPVVYYGSSITQGGCASRPGNSYQAMLSRMLDCDHINLGFSGNAKGEPEMAEYIAGLPMSAFVMDYDHNAPDAGHLRATHYAFYRMIRERRPELPIFMLSSPDRHFFNWPERRDVIRESYLRGVAEGDTHLTFIDGSEFFSGPLAADCTVDGVHPNDLGFYRMAETLSRYLPTGK